MKNYFRFIFVLFLLTSLISSCGYQSTNTYTYTLPDNISKVYIENPKNSTYEPNISIYLKKAIIDDLKLEPNFTVVTDKSQAQAFIETDIVSFSAIPSAYTASGFASMYECTINVKLSLVSKDGKKLIKDKLLTSSRSYSVGFNANTNDINAIESAKLKATKDAISDMASLIREQLFMSSGF